MDLTKSIRTIPDYPKPGIQFRDVTTLMADPAAFSFTVEALAAPWKGANIRHVAGIEARGFIFGAPVAHMLGAGFVPVRKKGKLPHTTLAESYALEYGTDEVEIHEDDIDAGERVLLIDDLIATGGTAAAAIRLLERVGADIAGTGFVIDLPDIGGADRLRSMGHEVMALVSFPGD